MMTGYGDVLETTNQNQLQSSHLSHQTNQVLDIHQQQQLSHNFVPTSSNAQINFDLLPNKTVPFKLNSDSFGASSSKHYAVPNVLLQASEELKRTDVYASSFQPISSDVVPNFNIDEVAETIQTQIEDRGRLSPIETLLDSPRSNVSKTSLPESNSELVLGALKNLLDKLKSLEIERDRAKQEIEKLDKERQLLALNKSKDCATQDSATDYRNRPLMYEAACNTSDPDSNTSRQKVDFATQYSLSSSDFRDQISARVPETLNFVQVAQNVNNNNAYAKISNSLHDRSVLNTGTYSYNSNTAPISGSQFEASKILRSSSNYPIPTGAASKSNSFSSSHNFNIQDHFGSLTPATSGYNGDYGTSRTFNRDESFQGQPFLSGYMSKFAADPRRSYDIGYDGTNSPKSYSFSTAVPATQGIAVPRSDKFASGYASGVPITVPPVLSDRELGLENYSRARSDDLRNVVVDPGRGHENVEVQYEEESGESDEFENDGNVNDADDADLDFVNLDGNRELERSFTDLQHSTEAVEMQFRQAEDRCASLELQLNSMQKLVDEHKKFTEQIDKPKSANQPGSANFQSGGSALKANSIASSTKQQRSSAKQTKPGRNSKSSRSVSPNDSFNSRNSEQLKRNDNSDQSRPSSSASKGRHVSFQAPKSSKKEVKPRSRSLDRTMASKGTYTRGHYHANFAELPFICGTSTNPSHSVNVNLQRVLAALKMHSSACQSANVTGTIVNNMKPPPGVKRVTKKRKKKSLTRPNSACEMTVLPEETIAKDKVLFSQMGQPVLTTATRTKKCDFTSESSMKQLARDLYKEFEDLAVQFEEINQERELSRDQQLSVELAREQMMLRKKMEAKQTQIDKVESHLNALRNDRTRKSSGCRKKTKKMSSNPKISKPQGTGPKFDTSSELLKNMQKLQCSLRRDDVKWD